MIGNLHPSEDGMTRKSHQHLVVVLLVAASLAIPLRHASANSPDGGLRAGSDAPQFQGRDLSGDPVDLSAAVAGNKAVIVNFWGLRCGACLQEMPLLDGIYVKYRQEGLSILGVNVDGVGADIIKAQLPRVLEIPSYTIVPDEELKVADLYKLTAAPLTVLVDPTRKIVYIHEGYRPGDETELEGQVRQLLH